MARKQTKGEDREERKKRTLKNQKVVGSLQTTIGETVIEFLSHTSKNYEGKDIVFLNYFQFVIRVNKKDVYLSTDRKAALKQYHTIVYELQLKEKNKKRFARTKRKWNTIEKVKVWHKLEAVMNR